MKPERPVAARHRELLDQRTRWLELIRELVAIDSGPDDVAGATAVTSILRECWQGLDFDVELLPEAALLIARHRVRDPAGHVLLVGHYDTVFPAGTAASRQFAADANGTATGPGAADMKAGLAMELAAVEAAGATTLNLDITVMINGDEESGSTVSRPMIEALSAQADVALVFEPAERDGALVLGRPGVRRFRVQARGRSAHTGVDPENGRNALEGMAHLVIAIQALRDRPELGSVTVAQVVGGTRPNIVPASASALVDTRPLDARAFGEVEIELQRIAAELTVPGVTATVSPLEHRPVFSPTTLSQALADRLRQAAAELGMDLPARVARGSSDGNLTSGAGVPTLDGLGPLSGGLHTDEEWFSVPSFFKRAALVAAALDDLATSGLLADHRRRPADAH